MDHGQRKKPHGDPGFVYFIQAGRDGPIKIGYAHDPLTRLEGLQTAHHEELRLLMTVADNGTIEMQLHERFADLKIRGEWFRAEGDLASVLWLSGLVPHREVTSVEVV
jgi:T5orf172 domain